MPVTIYDIAKAAGVGIGTVSRALNNSGNIRPQTRDRILKIIKELNYKPHGMAQSLARRRTFTVASVVPFFFNYFYIDLLKNIQLELTRLHYDLYLYSVDRIDQKNSVFDRLLSERKADGILIISLDLDPVYTGKFLACKIPVVLVDFFQDQFDSIFLSNEKAAQKATQHLYDLGHRRIAMINGALDSFPARARLQGYTHALQQNALAVTDDYVVICESHTGEHGFNEQAGYHAMQRLLKTARPVPTAVFIASDVQAIGAMRAIKEESMKIPDDIALVSFDDIDFSRFVGLSTMRQPVTQMAAQAVQRLLERIEHKHLVPVQIELDADLIVRETCGARQAPVETHY